MNLFQAIGKLKPGTDCIASEIGVWALLYLTNQTLPPHHADRRFIVRVLHPSRGIAVNRDATLCRVTSAGCRRASLRPYSNLPVDEGAPPPPLIVTFEDQLYQPADTNSKLGASAYHLL